MGEIMSKKRDFKAKKKFGEFTTFGQYIVEGRDKQGLSRLSLVDRIIDKGQNVDEKTVILWEKDALYPDVTMTYILAEILEIHPNDLILAKQYMYEAGLNAIDMIFMRAICGIIDISIWKIHCFLNVFKWYVLLIILKKAWEVTTPPLLSIFIFLLFLFLSILAANKNFDDL